MICPHCRKTIREEERYLMSRDPDGELVGTPAFRRLATYLLAFLFLVGLFMLFAGA